MTFTKKVHAELVKGERLSGRRAYVRHCFLEAGVVSNPQNTYHMQFCLDARTAQKLFAELAGFNLHPKKIARGEHFIVYIKEADEICEVLRIMGAHKSLIALEQMRVEKSVRNSVNRQVNFETANLNKTAQAALLHIDAIEYIRDHVGFGFLPTPLAQIAKLRLENTFMSLAELGTLTDPPITKSGVNHRMRKICKIADDLRQNYMKAGEAYG